MIKNEHDFSRWLRHELERISIIAIPIESHGTRNGLPDLFIMGYGSDIWIELKYIKVNKPMEKRNKVIIPFRPGQLAFAAQYTQFHDNKRVTYTTLAIQFTDALSIAFLPMDIITVKYLNEHNHQMTFADEAFCELSDIRKEVLYKLIDRSADQVIV